MALIVPLAFAVLATVTAFDDNAQPEPAGSGTVHGTVQGLTPAVHDAMFYSWQEGDYQRVTVMLTSFVGGCPDWSPAPPNVDDYEHGNIIGLELASREAVIPGTYELASNNEDRGAVAGVQAVYGGGATATGGAIQITSVSDMVMEGTYELMFDGEALAGTFLAGYCPGLVGSP
jgi:hypothetical protein